MTAQLSHEINNPIHNIQSLLETSLRKTQDGPARELLGVALEEVLRLAKLTRQMLDFYRGSVVDVPKEQIDTGTLLRELSAMHQERLSKGKIRLVIDTPAELPFLEGSKDKLKQVFINLITNAVDAMPNGGAITVKARSMNGVVRFDVADTGIGISEENRGRIFDAFFTTKKELSGVGLGLSVSYGIIQQHKGTIAVESTPGQGTTFIIQLPALRLDGQNSNVTSEQTSPS
jgi:two-component system NtrC family sensor kinase